MIKYIVYRERKWDCGERVIGRERKWRGEKGEEIRGGYNCD